MFFVQTYQKEKGRKGELRLLGEELWRKEGTRLGAQNSVGLREMQSTGMMRRDDDKVRKK